MNTNRTETNDFYHFIDEFGSFVMEMAENDRDLYFPLANEAGLKSSVTPNLCGDLKIDQNKFILEPVSIENLHNNAGSRNFWIKIKGDYADEVDNVWSLTGSSASQEMDRMTDRQDKSLVSAGIMWHKISRESKKFGIKSEITQFIPVQKNVEILKVYIENTSDKEISFIPTAAIPLYGRSADNIRDHRHVTSLLHRARINKYGVEVTPTLSFDERGHNINDITYYVEGVEGNGELPVGFFPEVADYIGKSGSFIHPESIYLDREPSYVADGNNQTLDGQEIVGAIRFAQKNLKPAEVAEYIVFIGACKSTQNPLDEIEEFATSKKCEAALEFCKKYWLNKCNVKYKTADKNFDKFMNWVNFQPELRRLFGCSFLPHHDYGKGGRGWRDLWQDCLALLIMNPDNVRQMLISNFAGVRIDGSNATIIGNNLGEFKADRNAITRVWMDHGLWPLITTKLYIDQTGDLDILYQDALYFKDPQIKRGTKKDSSWSGEMWQKDNKGEEYRGTVLEHLLLQNLTAFYEVGEHNHIRLRDADWNDAIDMASKRGESVAFTNAYAMNLETLAYLLEKEKERGKESVAILSEMEKLIKCPKESYDEVDVKLELLDEYLESCASKISGNKINVNIDKLIDDLREKADWIKKHIQKTEWVNDLKGNGWYNSYYDDNGRVVEGIYNNNVRMMLTGQVFSIMADTATEDQVKDIVKSADLYLFDESCGGYRLNTDFGEVKTDMGRMFGFAYGEKENGAVFSHMAVMYANALYRRGFAKDGYKVLEALYKQSMDYNNSRIYPGIPEYFGKGGRGLYHYLTGAASWYMLTVVTQMFGVHGEFGNLVIEPKLLAKQFDEDGNASIDLMFAGNQVEVKITNPQHLEHGEYQIKEAESNCTLVKEKNKVVLNKDLLNESKSIKIEIVLG